MKDGIDHINIYSKGEAQLGRDLSNFADLQIETLDGPFASIEGYWYWLNAPESDRKELLREKYGYSAKALGRLLRAKDWNESETFKLKIASAMISKLVKYEHLLWIFKESSLPFRHYYVFNGNVVEPESGKWIIETWEFLRNLVKNN